MSCNTPTDVSAWMAETSVTPGFSASVDSSASGLTASPHSASTLMTSAPSRSHIKTCRSQKNPLTHTTTLSPGDRMLASPASIPADPEPATVIVVCSVAKTCRNISCTDPSTSKYAGSRYPMIGCDMARKTRGLAELGPGPRIIRRGTLSRPRAN